MYNFVIFIIYFREIFLFGQRSFLQFRFMLQFSRKTIFDHKSSVIIYFPGKIGHRSNTMNYKKKILYKNKHQHQKTFYTEFG